MSNSTNRTVQMGPSSAQESRQTLQQRGIDATRYLRESLNLPTNLNDSGILGTALAEAAAEEIRRNTQLANEIRKRYEELISFQGRTKKRVQSKKQELAPLVPIIQDRRYIKSDPFSPPNPEFLIQVYGKEQLERALQEYTLDRLKQTAAKLEEQFPGTKPANRSRKDSVIAYIVKQSAGLN